MKSITNTITWIVGRFYGHHALKISATSLTIRNPYHSHHTIPIPPLLAPSSHLIVPIKQYLFFPLLWVTVNAVENPSRLSYSFVFVFSAAKRDSSHPLPLKIQRPDGTQIRSIDRIWVPSGRWIFNGRGWLESRFAAEKTNTKE